MSLRSRPFLLLLLLISIGMRTTIGAPCCLSGNIFEDAAKTLAAAAGPAAEHTHHAHHAHYHVQSETEGNDSHHGHGDGPTTNPCCSACGPTLPADLVQVVLAKQVSALPEPQTIRELVTRPPYHAYDATGPPFLI